MKRNCLLLFLITSLFLLGCNNEILLPKSESDLEKMEEKVLSLTKENEALNEKLKNIKIEKEEKRDDLMRVVRVNKQEIKYVRESDQAIAQFLTIISNPKDELVEKMKKVRFKGSSTGELVRVDVFGKVSDFQLVKLKWDEKEGKLKEEKILKKIPLVENTSLYIETYLPEGIPYERIKWKDDKGKDHELNLNSDGYGFAGSIYWN